jgi:uncharacterized protein (DUF58 family)
VIRVHTAQTGFHTTRFPPRREAIAMILKHRTVICREGWYYLGVLGFVVGGALIRQINLLLILAGMMAGPLLYNWREVIASLKGLHVRRKLPGGICAGDLLVVDLAAYNKSRRYGSWAIVVEDQVCREKTPLGGLKGSGKALFSHVPPNSAQHLSYYGRLTRRGRYRFGPMKISTRFPLGLIRRTVIVEQMQTMIVCPRLGHLTPAWTSLHQLTLRGSRKTPRRQNSLETEFFGVRDWQNGDSRRSIHWRTSARRGSLVIRQSEQQRHQDVLLLLDLWQPRQPTPEQLATVERAVSFAATVVADLCRQGGSRLDVGVGGIDLAISRGAASMARLSELMEQLAVADACPDDHLSELVRLGRETPRAGTVTLLVSTRPVQLAEGALQTGDDRPRAGGTPAAGMLVIDTSSETLNQYFHLE